MIILASTDALQVVSSAAATLDILASWVDLKADGSGDPAIGRTPTAMTTATTTSIVAAPASTFVRNVKEITIRNKHASLSTDVTVVIDVSATDYELHKVSLAPGEMLEYIEGVGWFEIENPRRFLDNQSTADQATSAGTDTYLAGSNFNFPAGRIAVGTKFYWRIIGTKSAAGTAAWSVLLRFGTAGTVSDTARCTLTQVTNVQTAVVDAGTWEIRAIVRGPIGASCIVAAGLEFSHHLATTGLSTVSGSDVYQNTSAAFDCTTVTNVGVSINPGASGVFTFQVVHGEAVNI
jgi:hypothetical protein